MKGVRNMTLNCMNGKGGASMKKENVWYILENGEFVEVQP